MLTIELVNSGTAIKTMTRICDIERKCVAIVRFGPSGFSTDGIRAGEYYQVTIDPKRVSPSGEFIRFGIHDGKSREGVGDELCGWQRCEALYVVEILGEWDGDQPPIMSYGDGFKTQMAD